MVLTAVVVAALVMITAITPVSPDAMAHHSMVSVAGVAIVDQVRSGNPDHDVGAKRGGAEDKKPQSQ